MDDIIEQEGVNLSFLREWAARHPGRGFGPPRPRRRKVVKVSDDGNENDAPVVRSESRSSEVTSGDKSRSTSSREPSEPLNPSDAHNFFSPKHLRKRKSVPPPDLSDAAKKAEPAVPKAKKSDAIVAAMNSMSLEMVPWKKIELEEEAKDSDDEEIDIIVRDTMDKPVEHWIELAETMDEEGKDYEIDYLVAAEPNVKPEDLTKQRTRVMIKWSLFCPPTWGIVKDLNPKGRGCPRSMDQMALLVKRTKAMARLDEFLRKESPDFDQKYPNRWISVEPKGDYVQEERSVYLNKVVAWEWRINFEYAKAHKHKARTGFKDQAPPPIYVVNWKDDAPVPGIDTPFKFITKLVPSLRVATILANTQEMAWVNCTDCNQTCTFPREHWHTMSMCCGVNYRNAQCHYDKMKLTSRVDDPEASERGGYAEEGPLTSTEIEFSTVVECVEACCCNGLNGKRDKPCRRSCVVVASEQKSEGGGGATPKGGTTPAAKERGASRCKQMVLQRGRLCSLIIFREDAVRGWGLRAGENIERGTLVTEYVGKVLTASEETKPASHYLFSMRYGWGENLKATDRVRNLKEHKSMIRRHKPFLIDAAEMGNEARFINHSCEPNLLAVVVYVERHGEFYHRIGLFARRAIAFGEELTFDYFPTEEDIKTWSSMFDECRCGMPQCKFKKADPIEDKEKKGEEKEDEKEEEESSDDDDCESVDSFLSDDEEYDRLCEENKKKKEEIKEKEKRKKEEKERKKREEKKKEEEKTEGKKDKKKEEKKDEKKKEEEKKAGDKKDEKKKEDKKKDEEKKDGKDPMEVDGDKAKKKDMKDEIKEAEKEKRKEEKEKDKKKEGEAKDRMEVDGEEGKEGGENGEEEKKKSEEGKKVEKKKREPYRNLPSRQDPFEVMVERYGGDREKAQKEWDKRMSSGVWAYVKNFKPWTPAANEELIKQSKEAIEKEKEKRKEEREKKEKEKEEKEKAKGPMNGVVKEEVKEEVEEMEEEQPKEKEEEVAPKKRKVGRPPKK